MTVVSPERTIALLVGVERYEVAAAWDLDGPALDAGRFADWLLDCGVPQNSIHLLASALPENERQLAGVKVPIRPADSATVRQVLTRELPVAPCDLFFFYWGGHGVIDARNTRRLFYADASYADKRNLDLTALMESLSSGFFSGQRSQLLVVDACQNLVSELRMVHTLPAETFPVGAPVAGRELDVMIAASSGEVAINIDSRKTGVFSETVLNELRRNGWPPSPRLLSQSVHDTFTARRAAGLTRQTPAHLWRHGRSEDWSVALKEDQTSMPRLPLVAVGRIADAMLELAEISDGVNRQEIIQFLPSSIRAYVPYAPRAKMHIVGLVRSCERFAEGREAMLEALTLGVSDREGLRRVLTVIANEWPA